MNNALREHVTRTGFDLSLTKTQVGAIIWLDLLLKDPETTTFRVNNNRRQWSPISKMTESHWASGIGSCITKGLVTHQYVEKFDEKGRKVTERPVNEFYGITWAGQLVIDLLKEAGIYEEYAVPLKADLLTEVQ